jgi:uncharacterized repeat protein (TIGR03803 family)
LETRSRPQHNTYDSLTSVSNGDGAQAIGNLILDTAGNLYGVTQFGGTLNQGTVFELSPPSSPGGAWIETVLYSFQGMPADGAQPVAGLVFDSVGNLYGTASLGGINADDCIGGCGTVFELSPPAAPGGTWTETVLYFFQGGNGIINFDGSTPLGGVIFDPAGNLYGTTERGGFGPGTIFELSPPSQPGGAWSEAILHHFAGGEGGGGEGGLPQAGVTFGPDGGTLFGTTLEDGSAGGGTVFSLQPPSRPGGHWSLAVIYAAPTTILAGVTIGNPHTFYTNGGSTEGANYIYQISDVGGTVTVTTCYPGTGAVPAATMIIYDGALYGTTNGGGGPKGYGTVFRVSP